MKRSLVSVMGMSALVLSMATGCDGDPKPENFYGKCVEVQTLIDGQLKITIDTTSSTKQQDGDIGVIVQPLYANTTKLWPAGSIPVCWDDYTYPYIDDTERGWVRDAVESTWNVTLKKAASALKQPATTFTGWERCNAVTETYSIIISGYDDGPHVKRLGKDLAGYPDGMVLNFWFYSWSEVCNSDESYREYCIRAIAVHEFGHALGIAHEQNRPDTPGTCTDAPQGSAGNVLFGEWDLNSVMNYCAPLWNNGGALSSADEFWIRVAYYPGTVNEAYCRSAADASVSDPVVGANLPDGLLERLNELENAH